MKIQALAVIFIIIVLPISMVLTVYIQSQVDTLELQINYDTKLKNATYDALKAFQLNTVNSSTSDLANSKMRDIEAAVNSFYNSIASNFNLSGYNKEILQDYVPALVFTMYDGYYIYSPFTNTISAEDEGNTYKNGDRITGLKPYIFYSCRYKTGNIDVVITYSLDNYITLQGTINNTPVNKYGYLLDNVENRPDGSVTYRGIEIGEETLVESNVEYDASGNGIVSNYYYTKINGVKYYSKDGNEWFTILNGERYPQSEKYKTVNDSAIRYYKEGKEFTDWVRTNLGSLSTANAVDENGNSLASEFGTTYPIFSNTLNPDSLIEDPDSNFNQHRLSVIKYSIEKNLSIAIANYNNYSEGAIETNFLMPELKEDEWDKIVNNVSIISFMQGLNIGGKMYNGYSIVTNTKTEEVVNIDSIYIVTNDGNYHRATDSDLVGNSNITGAYFNVDFERKSSVSGNITTYYYPHTELRMLFKYS